MCIRQLGREHGKIWLAAACPVVKLSAKLCSRWAYGIYMYTYCKQGDVPHKWRFLPSVAFKDAVYDHPDGTAFTLLFPRILNGMLICSHLWISSLTSSRASLSSLGMSAWDRNCGSSSPENQSPQGTGSGLRIARHGPCRGTVPM